MLKAEKRHTAACKVSEYDRNHTKCKCSYRAVGMLNGVFVRKALKTSNYDQAQKIIRGMEATGAPEQRREAVKIEDAVASFMRDIAARSWQESTQRKFRTLLVDRLRFYASSEGYRYLNQMTLDVVTEFRATWKDAPLTAQKNIERLRMKCGCRIEGPAAEQGVLGRNNARLSRRRAALVTTPILSSKATSVTPVNSPQSGRSAQIGRVERLPYLRQRLPVNAAYRELEE